MLSLLALFASCSNSVQELPEQNNATFTVAQLKADSELVAHAAIPTLKEANFLHFKTCLRDVAVQGAIIGEEFEVQALDQTHRLRTDGEGCLAWSQAFIFPWLTAETWVKQEISIKATGHHLGKVIIPLYFNPWREGGQSIIDGRYHLPAGPVSNVAAVRARAQTAANHLGKSPLNLTNLQWSVLRRRQRDNITILEWQLQATPVFERTDLSGQIQREVLANGRAELHLQLESNDVRGVRQRLSDSLEQAIQWQGGSLIASGEFAVASDKLPRLGELAELFIELKLPTPLPSVRGVLPLDGIQQSSVSELQSFDEHGRAQDLTEESDKHDDLIGQLDVSSMKIVLDNDDLDGYYLDEHLNLSLTKKYRLEFSPTVILPGAQIMGQSAVPLTYGQMQINVHLYAPKHIGVDYENPDLTQFTHLTSSSATASARADAIVSQLFKFPMPIAQTPLLRLKNLMLVEIIPKDDLQGIAGQTFSLEFLPLAANNQITAYAQKAGNFIDEQIVQTQRGNQRGLIARSKKSVDLLAESLQARATKTNSQFVRKNLSQVTNATTAQRLSALLGARVKTATISDFRTMMSTRTLPRATLATLCREFFALPKVQRVFSWGTFSDQAVGGEQWRACVENPQDFLRLSPSDHVEEFLRAQQLAGVTVTKPSFLSQARGDIFRGTGFFAAFGDRSSEGTGERTSSGTDSHIGFELTIPFVTSVGMGGENSHSVYRAIDKATMLSSFERQYTQKSDIELEYNRITLEFLARMRRCVSVEARTAKKIIMICEDQDRLARIQENWYFVGDTRLNKLGVITNATLPDDLNMAQILRGEASFKNIWGEFREEDRALVLEKLEGASQGILHAPLTEELVHKENIIGVGFPGAVIPY